ncbi:MAG: zeta toxin family protein [Thermoleophilia bacterium]|nr:zeta toxin family protein [Thermoleophilia bacterium]
MGGSKQGDRKKIGAGGQKSHPPREPRPAPVARPTPVTQRAPVARPEGAHIRLVSDGHAVPFSKGLLATTLTATGLPPERAHAVALDVEWQLLQGGERDISVERLRQMVELVLAESEGQLYLERYRKWNRLAREDRPVIILIGGATGVGKSTIAAQLADRLGVVRIISTDAIREVMRAFFSKSLMPAIHYSSYEADKAVRIPLGSGLDSHVVGFMEQVEMVNVGVMAVLERAIKERTGLLIEGVHIVPGMLASAWNPQLMEDVLFLPMIVAVRDRELHRSHFLVREQETSGRRAIARYLQGFEEIRRIQDFILERAEAEGTLVVDNISIDDTVGTVVDALYDLIEKRERASSAAG